MFGPRCVGNTVQRRDRTYRNPKRVHHRSPQSSCDSTSQRLVVNIGKDTSIGERPTTTTAPRLDRSQIGVRGSATFTFHPTVPRSDCTIARALGWTSVYFSLSRAGMKLAAGLRYTYTSVRAAGHPTRPPWVSAAMFGRADISDTTGSASFVPPSPSLTDVSLATAPGLTRSHA